MDPAATLARILDLPPVAAVRAPIDLYNRAAGSLLAKGLAFAALFTAIPSLLLILGVVGWVANDSAARDRISGTLISLFPPLEGLVADSVEALSNGAALTSIAGVIGVIWTVSQFYGSLDLAVARIYSDEPERSLILRTARGFATVVLLAALVIGLVVLGSLGLALETTTTAPSEPFRVLVTVLNSPLASIVLASVAVLLIYRAVPARSPSWRAVGIPAVAVGAMIVVLSRAFVVIVPWLLGAQALAGSLASAFVTLAWLSLTFQGLLLGAAWVRVRQEGQVVSPTSTASASLEGAAAPAEPGGGGQ
jgi:membrane protein